LGVFGVLLIINQLLRTISFINIDNFISNNIVIMKIIDIG
jgi:hypothetical protein